MFYLNTKLISLKVRKVRDSLDAKWSDRPGLTISNMKAI